MASASNATAQAEDRSLPSDDTVRRNFPQVPTHLIDQLTELLRLLRLPPSREQQMQVFQHLRAHPTLMSEFMRHRRAGTVPAVAGGPPAQPAQQQPQQQQPPPQPAAQDDDDDEVQLIPIPTFEVEE